MPETLAVVGALRKAGRAAVVSGAGPSVLVLDTDDHQDFRELLPAGWQQLDVPIEQRGCFVVGLDHD